MGTQPMLRSGYESTGTAYSTSGYVQESCSNRVAPRNTLSPYLEFLYANLAAYSSTLLFDTGLIGTLDLLHTVIILNCI